jgi:predicted NACHT family NTPase
MSEKIYHWRRFWCPRASQINLGDRGYLCDPESEYGHLLNPELVGLDAIAAVPCLILLGEPGIGKSKAMKFGANEQDSLVLDLKSYGSEDRLIKDLFESSQFRDWVAGNHSLNIFLDSLDECLLRIDNVTELLAKNFERHQDKADRLFIRIVCRTAIWPPSFEKQLQQIWGEDKVKVYQLAPLRWLDVRQAAECEGIENPDLFMREILDKRVVPLAIKPITLGFLLNIYLRNGQFSQEQTLSDLYLEGCRILCDEEEDKPDFLLPGRKGNLELDQRLIIAARIAAVTVFANRDAVWIGRDRGQVPEDDVQSPELAQGYENINGRPFEACEESITEVLRTGLFSLRDTNRIGWAHKTYAEFLAAWYLKQHSLSTSQILKLIIHPDRKVVPQLQETTAWLAGMMPDIFQEVVKTDPDVLLKSDIATTDHESKSKLVESLLKLHNEDKLEIRVRRYDKLNYPGLAAQLEAYIRDSTKNQDSRYVAIDIAIDCKENTVQNCLIGVALDITQPYEVRKHAACAICEIGDGNAKAQLKPLALGEVGEDPDDDLKGYGFQAIWPQYIAIEDLLSQLPEPTTIGKSGSRYQDFIAEELTEFLELSDLPTALKWIETLPDRHKLDYPFINLSDSIMLKAWQNFDKPDVTEAFANVAMFKLKRYEGILGTRSSPGWINGSEENYDAEMENFLHESDEKRRKLIETIISLIAESENGLSWLTELVCSKDILWIIERVVSSESDRAANKTYNRIY